MEHSLFDWCYSFGTTLLYYSLVWSKESLLQHQNNTVHLDLNDDSTIYTPGKSGFAFAFTWSGVTTNLIDENTQLTYSVQQVKLTLQSDGSVLPTVTDLETQLCDDSFPYSNKAALRKYGITGKYICVKSEDYELAGTTFSDDESYVRVQFSKCSSGCDTDANIDAAIKNSFVNMITVDSYFDFSNYDDPIQESLNGYPIYLKSDLTHLSEVMYFCYYFRSQLDITKLVPLIKYFRYLFLLILTSSTQLMTQLIILQISTTTCMQDIHSNCQNIRTHTQGKFKLF